MSYCHECGEQVATEDVFCPYCGISLKPIVPIEDASMTETIVGIPPGVLLGTEPPPATDAPAGANLSEPRGAAAAGRGDTVENWTLQTDPAGSFDDAPPALAPEPPTVSDQFAAAPIPPPPSPFDASEPAAAPEPAFPEPVALPPALADFGAADAPLPAADPKPEIAPPAENVAEAENPPVAEIVSEAENIPAAPISPVAELTPEPEFSPAPELVPEPAQTPAGSVADEPEPPREAETSTAAEPSPVAENPPFDDWAPAAPAVPAFVPEISAAPESEEPAAPAASESEEPPVAPEPAAAEPPIEMPEMPLPLDERTPDSRFDSVEIISREDLADALPPVRNEPPAPPAAFVSPTPEPAAPPPVSNAEPRAESRSYTTPNIGHTDTDGRKAAKLKPLDEGTILNARYEIVRKIGGGGMGAVYLANDRNLGGVLRAVKEMVQSYIESEQQDKAIADFKRESLLLTSLDHPAIPTIYDYFFDEKEGRFYLVMKYISGGDLASRLRAAPEGRIDEKSVTEWAIQIADVLDYLHNHEPAIVYRDLKPANVMIDGNSGRVMLIDFGIARWVNKEEKGVTAVGTMGYAPPELFSGNVEARSDIYSLGSTMFHLLTGADPQSNPLLIFDFQKNPRPRQINSQLSDQIEQILMRAVEYNADARFRSAAELREALKEHFNNLMTGKVTYGVKAAPSARAFSEQAVFCGFCGKQIVATDVFCAFCGAQQPIAQQQAAPPVYAPAQPLTAKLLIVGTGDLEPASFRLEKSENLLGRRDPMSNIFPEVDLSKFDPQTKISRRHARIWRDGNNFLVEDLGSSNGTTLLPTTSDVVRLLPHQAHTLTNGDRIKLGDTTLHFTIG